ncbi:MAG: helix-turn-helix transcriptional regulator [Candidatus Krumholzibacteriia bacterium]
MTTKQITPPETTNEQTKDSILPQLEHLLRELAREHEPQLGEEIERSIIARIDAYQRAVIKSVEALCANALVNSRDIERLNCIVASLPETKTENADFRRILASIENHGGDTALSKREKGVLTQLVWGKSNREISETLGISDKTVKNHLWKIYRKLGVGNRSQLFHKLIA